uniref:Putative secreted protein n=1 Tax=Anopheles darlingi TaxID=43151 RepID=A0A2M4DIU4_ANODA
MPDCICVCVCVSVCVCVFMCSSGEYVRSRALAGLIVLKRNIVCGPCGQQQNPSIHTIPVLLYKKAALLPLLA